MIISSPREIRIQLDPDYGFAVGFSVLYAKSITEAGQVTADLGPHIETVAPDAPLVAASIADLNAANAVALLTYQTEVQRLAGELAIAQARISELLPGQ